MKKEYIFKKNGWDKDDFEYVYSPICNTFGEFIQEDDYIRNFATDGKFEYISMISKACYKTGTMIYLKCSFDTFGAPLIVLTDDIKSDGKVKRYDLHFEVVAYEDGFNVWRIVPDPENVARPIKTSKILAKHFKIEDEATSEITLKVEEKRFVIDVNGVKGVIEHDDIPESFNVGFTACEGINRLYEFSIEMG